MTDSDFQLLIQRFYQLQGERVETYRLFDEMTELQIDRKEAFLPDNLLITVGGESCYYVQRSPPEYGHQAYLKSGPHYDFIHYRQLVHEITQAFNGISKELIQMKDQFRELHDRSDLSEHLEKIQEIEKEKLELTARLQLAKQNAQDHPSDESHQEEVQLLKHKIIKTVEAISEVLQDFKYDCEEIK